MSDFDSSPNPENNDPIKRAFDERREAAQHVGIETGLASVHRTNAPARRMAKAGGAFLVAAAILGGGYLGMQGGESTVRTDLADESEQPETTQAPPTSDAPVVPETTIPDDGSGQVITLSVPGGVFLIADGSSQISSLDPRDPDSLTTYETGLDGITDAFGDLSGGVVLETGNGIFYKQPNAPMTQLVTAAPGRTINLIDVAMDHPSNAMSLWFTEHTDAAEPTSRLYRLQLEAATVTEPIDLGVFGGGEAASSGGAIGYSYEGAGDTIVYLAMSDGPCTWVLAVDGVTGNQTSGDRVCVAEGGGTASFDELIVAVGIDEETGQVLTYPAAMLSPGAMLDRGSHFEAWVGAPGGEVFAREIDSGGEFSTGQTGVSVRTIAVPIEAFAASAEPTDTPPDGPTINAIDLATYQVIDVASDDVLFIRERPDPQSNEVSSVANGSELEGTGSAARLASGAEWIEVQIPNTQSAGWVNGRFLQVAQSSQPSDESFAAVPCLAQSGSTAIPHGTTSADHVADLRSDQDGPCRRIVIELGSGFSFDGPGQPAENVPEGVVAAASTDGQSIVVDLGPSIELANFETLRAGDALVTNNATGALQVEILSGSTAFGTFVMTNPARIVVDYLETSVPPGAKPVPLAEDAGVIIRSIDALSFANGSPVISGPATVRGFARPFEAQLGLSMLDGNGDLMDAVTWNGGYQPNFTGSEYATFADWQVMGSFEFTFEGLPPGDYTLRLSNDYSAADEPTYLEYDFTVAQ